MAQISLRDLGQKYKLDVGYDEAADLASIFNPSTGKYVSFKSGSPEAAKYGLSYQDGRHYTDFDNPTLKSALGITDQPTPQNQYGTQMSDILTKLSSGINKPFSYNPKNDPAYQSAVREAGRQAKTASGRAMEELNSRGILNSTVTSDRLGQIEQESVAGVNDRILPQLMNQAYSRYQDSLSNMTNLANIYQGLESQAYDRERQAEADRLTAQNAEVEREQAKLDNAWGRVKQLGYVDNAASVILGIPVGTRSFDAQKSYDDRQSRLQIAREQISGAMARTQASNAASMARTRYTQGQINSRQNNDMTEQEVNNLALQMAKADPRLADENNVPDGVNFFTLNQLLDAYKTQLTEDTGGDTGGEDVQSMIDQARANGYSDPEIADSLREDGIDPAEYGL